jgi:hypothetical protein
MRKVTTAILLSILAVTLGYAQGLQHYEYWMDSDYSKHTTMKGTDEELNLSIDVSKLSQGVHFLNFRAQNTDGDWSTISRYLYFIPEITCPDAQVTDYEYWIDGIYSEKKSAKVSSGDIAIAVDVSQLSIGVHYYNFRAKNTDGVWGNLSRYLFYMPEPINDDAIVTDYEYWLDGEYSGKQTAKVSSGDITIAVDISKLSAGVHYYNFRAKYSDGVWGNLSRYLFYVPETVNENASIASYEYWLDEDYSAKTVIKDTSGDVFASIDVSQVEPGVHYFNFRAKNSESIWGNLSRYLVYIPAESETGNSPIVGYRYNFNNSYTYIPIADRMEYELNNYILDIPDLIEMGSLEDGCTYTFASDSSSVRLDRNANVSFSIQFKNKKNEWSAPSATQFEMSDSQERKLTDLPVQKSIVIDKVAAGDFAAFKMTVGETRNYYLKASQSCKVRLYESNGSLLTTINPESLFTTFQIGLTKGTYYGIVYNTVKDKDNADDHVTLKLMLTDNVVPTPTITWNNEVVTISCEQEGAEIYYTTDGTIPTKESRRYQGPFEWKQNATIKAVAFYHDLADSDVAMLVIDSYKVEKPTIEFTNLRLYMTCPTEGANIFFTLDGSDPTANGQRYTEPVSVTANCTVKAIAKRDGYNNSDITTFTVDISNVKTSTPTITRQDDKTLLVSSHTEGAVFYYTTDGTTPTINSPHTDGLIKLDHNCVVSVIAMKEGEIASDKATFTVDWLRVDTPVLTFNDGKLTISCSTPGSTIYYIIGEGTPSVVYTGPIVLTDNRSVTAMAKAKYLLDSELATYNPDAFTCEPVTFIFDGHELQLSCATNGAVIYYTTDGTQPSSDSPQFSDKIVINEILTVKAIAMRPHTNNSIQTTYTIPAYYNGKQAEVGIAGELSKAFGWCKTEDIEQLVVKGTLNETDLATLRNMDRLEHLDMGSVKMSGNRLPDKAFKDMALVSIIIPEGLTGAGSGLFDGCQQLAAIKWLTNFKLTELMLQSVDNPNLLVYVKLQSDAPTTVKNVVVNGYANEITLTDRLEGNNNFYCPEVFTAGRISYQHSYQQQTVVGECRGWETLTLPFDVESIKHKSQGQLAPFAKDDANSKPFWLCRLGTGGFERADRIEANTPYIISLPNNQSYADQYILGGDVTFEARNAKVYASTDYVIAEKGEFTFVPCFTLKSKDAGVLPLNVRQEFEGFPEGSNFFRNLQRDVRPFECYIQSSSGNAHIFSINEETAGIEELYVDNGGRLKVYNTSGQCVLMINSMDELINTHRLRAGVYLVNGKKIIVNR